MKHTLLPKITIVPPRARSWRARHSLADDMLDQLQTALVPLVYRRVIRRPMLSAVTDRVAAEVEVKSTAADLLAVAFEIASRRFREGDAEWLFSKDAKSHLIRAVTNERGGRVRWAAFLDSFTATLIEITVTVAIGYLRSQFPVLNPVTVSLAAGVLEAILDRRSDSRS